MSDISNPYIVVFEHNNRESGHSGVRVWKQFSDKKDPGINDCKNTFGKIIAEGISEKEALNLVALTPEACYLSDATQNVIHYGEVFVPEFIMIAAYLNQAFEKIVSNRETRLDNHLNPSAHFLDVFVEYQTDSAAGKLFGRVVSTMVMDDKGNIGALDRVIPSLAEILLSQSIIKQLEKRSSDINCLYCPV